MSLTWLVFTCHVGHFQKLLHPMFDSTCVGFVSGNILYTVIKFVQHNIFIPHMLRTCSACLLAYLLRLLASQDA